MTRVLPRVYGTSSSLSPEDREAISAVRILNLAQLDGLSFEVVGFVEGFSCQNKMWEPAASRSAAVEQLKYRAWKIGADGITNIEFGSPEGTSLRTNCWDMIRASAEAVRVERLD